MIKSPEKIKKLTSLLEKGNPVIISEAVQMLREDEPFEGAVELLAAYYDKNCGVMVNNAIQSFMNDLKDKSLRVEVIREIKATHKPETTSMLVASCWQSGLDYSGYCIDFTEIFLCSEYSIAVECMTVIEESLPALTTKEKHSIASRLRSGIAEETAAKKALAMDLISVIGE